MLLDLLGVLLDQEESITFAIIEEEDAHSNTCINLGILVIKCTYLDSCRLLGIVIKSLVWTLYGLLEVISES